jgi:hypothetical protein
MVDPLIVDNIFQTRIFRQLDPVDLVRRVERVRRRWKRVLQREVYPRITSLSLNWDWNGLRNRERSEVQLWKVKIAFYLVTSKDGPIVELKTLNR